ncbi:hypothetical protein [Nannocystis punicea]|uniref:Uncharacterized protein n=1 Tax=Nannocystis punicea TaxID=2995304 RepID=A0ABY7H7D5_9BACT|nr:hypothetical protein [Nannocystis poenicansa]WAS95189.1 hypothetical protein O0S08_03425 [Nannocystis poenicansa]
MLRAFTTESSGGFEDLAAVATFLVLGAIGLGVGTLVDILRHFLAKKSAPG